MEPPATRRALASLVLAALVGLGLIAPVVGFVGPAAAATTIAGCGTISSPGTYTLTADVVDSSQSRCLEITANDVVLDGNGHTVDGPDTGIAFGVFVENPSTTATNVTVRNLVVTGWGSGVYYRGVENGAIRNVDAHDNADGIRLYDSRANTIDGVTATGNGNGLTLESGSSSNTVTASTFSANANYGVSQANAGTNTFVDVVANDNEKGFILSDSHRIEASEIRNNSQWGVFLGGVNNVLTGNTIAGNGHGLVVGKNAGDLNGVNHPNRVSDNRFNNTNNTNAHGTSLFGFTTHPNHWNTTAAAGTNVIGGSTLGGNYWAKPDGTGVSQTCTDGDVDGICDSAYTLGTDNVDHHPLTVAQPNDPPAASFLYAPSSPTTDDTVDFTAQATDPDGTVVGYAWDFDADGATDATGQTAAHSFASAGDHLVTLTVTDDAGATATDQQLVSVAMGSGGGGGVQMPSGTVTISQDQPAHVQPGETVTVVLFATDVDAITVRPNSTLGAADGSTLDLAIDGQAQPFGTTRTFSSPRSGNVTIEVATTSSLADAFSLVIEDDAGNVLATTSPTGVHPDPISVPTDVPTIQDAIDIAAPGTTIEVDDGTYREELAIEKDLTLTAAPGASPVVGTPSEREQIGLVWIGGSSTVTIDGIDFLGQDVYDGVRAGQDASVTLRNLTALGFHEGGLVASFGAQVTATNVAVITTSRAGVYVVSDATLVADSLTIRDTGHSALVVRDGGSATVRNSAIQGAGLNGVTSLANGTATVVNTVITDPGDHGIEVHTDASATVDTVTVVAPGIDGMAVSDANATVRTLTVREAGDSGIRVDRGGQATIDDSVLVNATASGLVVASGANATAANLSVTGSDDGISLADATFTLSGGDFRALAGPAIDVHNATLNAADVHVPDTSSTAARVNGSSTARITALNVTTSGHGVALRHGADATIDGSRIDAEFGVYAATGATATVTATHIRAEYGVGIQVNRANATIADSDIEGSYGIGGLFASIAVTNTSITNVSLRAISVTDGSLSVRDSYVETGDGPGLYLVDVDTAISDTVVVAPGTTGVVLRAGSHGAIRRTTVHAETGIRLIDDVPVAETTVTLNDLQNTTVAIDNENDTATLDATGNWYGPRGPIETAFGGAITVEPFLTAPPDQIPTDEVQPFGYALELPAGPVYAFGTPAPLATTLATAFNDFDGAIYVFDAATGSWSLATGDERLGAMDAVAVVPTTDARVVVDFADATPPRPTERQLAAGWNLVAPRAYDDLDGAFSTATVGLSDVSQTMAEPLGQPAPPGDAFGHYTLRGTVPGDGPRVSPFTGYFVYVTAPGTIPGTVPVGETVDDVRVHLGIDGTEAQPA